MRPTLRQEDGWALVTGVIVLMLMMGVGLAAFSVVDTQTNLSKKERNRESSFNLTEGALQQQSYVLGFNWPANAPGYQDCSYGGATSNTPAGQCPQPANLTGGNFTQADFTQGASWTTVVRDNRTGGASAPVSSQFYDSTVNTTPCQGTTTVPCTYDANGDGTLWVRASSTVKGKTRTIVALMRRERITEGFPRAVVKADHFRTTNNGNKVIIDSTGGQIVTRCQNVPNGQSCADYQVDKGQVTPAGTIVTEPPQTAPTMSAGQLARFKVVAQSSSPPTYFTSCPSSLAGAAVYIDVASGTQCKFNSNSTYNTAQVPGFVIMPKGTIELRGGITYYGVMYFANQAPGTTGAVLDIGGNATVYGGVIIDGGGGLDVGSSGNGGQNLPNLQYAPNAFNALTTFGTAGLIQNTWRELPPNTN